MFLALDPNRLIDTIEKLHRRTSERFPESGLSRICGELAGVARQASERVSRIARPHFGLRIGIFAALALGLALLGYLASIIDVRTGSDSVYSVLQGIDAAFNIIVVLGAVVIFLLKMEEASKRKLALKDLHELRSIAHVIDMHQLTKDPGMRNHTGGSTPSSPKRTLSEFELSRYLDYCTEMLSLTGKIAALYAQSTRDATVLATANDLEQLSANLSEKIWQKIAILHQQRIEHTLKTSGHPAGSEHGTQTAAVAVTATVPVQQA